MIHFVAVVRSLSLVNPMGYSPPGSSVHGIFQARILQWVTISFSKGSSRPRDQTHISCIGRQSFCHGATWVVLNNQLDIKSESPKVTEHWNLRT